MTPEPMTPEEISAIPAKLLRPMTAKAHRALIHRLLATVEKLERETITAKNGLEWAESVYNAFVAVHHATCDSLSARLEIAEKEREAALADANDREPTPQ